MQQPACTAPSSCSQYCTRLYLPQSPSIIPQRAIALSAPPVRPLLSCRSSSLIAYLTPLHPFAANRYAAPVWNLGFGDWGFENWGLGISGAPGPLAHLCTVAAAYWIGFPRVRDRFGGGFWWWSVGFGCFGFLGVCGI